MTVTAVRERGIPFTAPMVLAMRREVDPKTQTRRLVRWWQEIQFLGASGDDKSDPRWWGWENEDGGFCSLMPNPDVDAHVACPYGGPGDLLRVNESHRFIAYFDDRAPVNVPDTAAVWYEADGPPPKGARRWGRLRPPRFMRKPFSRMKREIVEVRAQRLHDITEEDARAEGFPLIGNSPAVRRAEGRFHFGHTWTRIHGPDSWARNPWVWTITFRRVEA